MYEEVGENSINGLFCFVQINMLIILKNELIDAYFYPFLLYHKHKWSTHSSELILFHINPNNQPNIMINMAIITF